MQKAMRKMQNFFENKIVKPEFKKFCTIYFGLMLVQAGVGLWISSPFTQHRLHLLLKGEKYVSKRKTCLPQSP